MMESIWKNYDAETKYPDVTAYILGLIRENKKLEEKADKSDEYYRAMREFQERNSNQAHQIRELKKKLEELEAS